MKRPYETPRIKTAMLVADELLQASGVTGTTDIDWGGYDDDGDLDPAGKLHHFDVWDDENDDIEDEE